MTDLDLDRFIKDNDIEYSWSWNRDTKEDDVVVWIPFYLIEEFSELIKPDDSFEGGLDVSLKGSSIALWASEVCIYYGISLIKVFKK